MCFRCSLLPSFALGTGTRTHPSQVTYNGDDLATGGVKVTNLVKMVDQEDRHMPLLTVRETLAYAERFQAAVRSS